jgi:hypothetical protein
MGKEPAVKAKPAGGPKAPVQVQVVHVSLPEPSSVFHFRNRLLFFTSGTVFRNRLLFSLPESSSVFHFRNRLLYVSTDAQSRDVFGVVCLLLWRGCCVVLCVVLLSCCGQTHTQLSEASLIAKLEWQEKLRSHDDLRQGLVVCSGALAKHLDKDDPQVLATVDLLVMALSTPSEIVQRSVAGVLAPLMKTMDGEHVTLTFNL